PAQIPASTLRLAGRRLVPDLAQEIAKRALRYAPAEICAQRPEHRADVFDRMAVDRQAAHDNDAPALLDVVEYAFEGIVERGVAAMLSVDFAKRQPRLAHPYQHVLEGGDEALGKVERDIVLGEIAAAPCHRMVNAVAKYRSHQVLSKTVFDSDYSAAAA